MKKNEILDALKNGKTVTVNVTAAKIVWRDDVLKPINHYRSALLTKIIIADDDLGSIFFSGFSDKIACLRRGEKVSLKLTVTGVGQPSDRYPDPILFAKAHTRKNDAVTVVLDQPAEDSDLSINV